MLYWQADSLPLSRRYQRHGFDPWVWKIFWSRKWQPTPVFLPGKFHGQRSLWAKVHRGQSLTCLSMHAPHYLVILLCKTMKERELALGRRVKPIKILCSLLQKGRAYFWGLLRGSGKGVGDVMGGAKWGLGKWEAVLDWIWLSNDYVSAASNNVQRCWHRNNI